MIIQLSGKKRTGKNEASKILQWLINRNTGSKVSLDIWLSWDKGRRERFSKWEEKSYAHKIKLHVADMLNVPVEMMEDEKWRTTELGEEWRVWELKLETINDSTVWTKVDKLDYDFNAAHGIYDARTYSHTPRALMQQVGTEVGRAIHPDYWINGLLIDYKALDPENAQSMGNVIDYKNCKFPNWIITDCRFLNEVSVSDRIEGFVIRLERDTDITDEHESETALEGHKFENVVYNNGTIYDLRDRLETILKREGVIK